MLHLLLLSLVSAALIALITTLAAPVGSPGAYAWAAVFGRRVAGYIALWWAVYLAGWILSRAWSGAGGLGVDHTLMAPAYILLVGTGLLATGGSAAHFAAAAIFAAIGCLTWLAIRATLGVPGHG